jgi:hypothetical protein
MEAQDSSKPPSSIDPSLQLTPYRQRKVCFSLPISLIAPLAEHPTRRRKYLTPYRQRKGAFSLPIGCRCR